jgi:hypothetical protein
MTETVEKKKPTPKAKTLATVVAGVIIAVTPALFTYLENRDEIKAKYRKTQEDATAGYAALAVSVKELQAQVVTQHEFIIKLEANLAAMDKYVLDSLNRVMSQPARIGDTSPLVVTRNDKPPAPITPPINPKFRELPADLPNAAVQYAPKH